MTLERAADATIDLLGGVFHELAVICGLLALFFGLLANHSMPAGRPKAPDGVLACNS